MLFQECIPVSRPAHKAKDFWSNLLPISYKDHFVSKKSSKVSSLSSTSTPSNPLLQKSSNNQSDASGMKMEWVAFNLSFCRMEGKCHAHNFKRFKSHFLLKFTRGKIHHIQPGTPLGRLEADGIFIEYQQQATAGELKFRRWPMRSVRILHVGTRPAQLTSASCSTNVGGGRRLRPVCP